MDIINLNVQHQKNLSIYSEKSDFSSIKRYDKMDSK